MSWYKEAKSHMQRIYLDQISLGETDKIEIGKIIDANYPFGQRKMFPYKAWLRARKEFFSKYGLGKIPEVKKDDLFYIEKFDKKNHYK